MTKTKRQLRAEAVERLRDKETYKWCYGLHGVVLALMGVSSDTYDEMNHDDMRECIIDLLTDEDEPPYDSLIRALEGDYGIRATWDGLRKFWNIEFRQDTPAMDTDVPDSGHVRECPKSDAVELMRQAARGYKSGGELIKTDRGTVMEALRKLMAESGEYEYAVGGGDASALLHLADMVERDYVRRDEYDDAAELCHRHAKEICELRAERDEWQDAYDSWQLQTEKLMADRDALLDLIRDAAKDYADAEHYMHKAEEELAACEDQLDDLTSDHRTLMDERDEWKEAYDGCKQICKELVAECERWKAKAEQVDTKSVKPIDDYTIEDAHNHGFKLLSLFRLWHWNVCFPGSVHHKYVQAYVEEIEQELDSYVELPKDADGKYWHPRDKADTIDGVGTVDTLEWDGYKWYINIDSMEWERQVNIAAGLCYHHEPTLEEVLAQLANTVHRAAHTDKVWDGEWKDATIADYAARIRELMGVDE